MAVLQDVDFYRLFASILVVLLLYFLIILVGKRKK